MFFAAWRLSPCATIHTTGSTLGLRRYPDASWYAMASLKSLLQFAVPAFLMLSALVLTRSLLRDASLGRYVRNRLTTVLWPTIVWTLLCIPYAHWLRPEFSWDQTTQRVLEGTAQFHLYFLRVLLQMCLILPFLMPLARKRLPFWKVLPLTVVLTLAFLRLQSPFLAYPHARKLAVLVCAFDHIWDVVSHANRTLAIYCAARLDICLYLFTNKRRVVFAF